MNMPHLRSGTPQMRHIHVFVPYCSGRWRMTDVGGSGAGSPQMLQKRAFERFICPHGQGRRLAVFVVDCAGCCDGPPNGASEDCGGIAGIDREAAGDATYSLLVGAPAGDTFGYADAPTGGAFLT